MWPVVGRSGGQVPRRKAQWALVVDGADGAVRLKPDLRNSDGEGLATGQTRRDGDVELLNRGVERGELAKRGITNSRQATDCPNDNQGDDHDPLDRQSTAARVFA